MTNKQRIMQMVERWRDDISFDEAVYHMYALGKIDAGLKSAGFMSLDSEPPIDHDKFFDKLDTLYVEKSAAAVLEKNRRKRPTKASSRKSEKPPAKSDEKVFCRSCNQYYEHSSLIRHVESFPGIKRKGGGPNGARREVWKCCPNGHGLIRVSLRVS